MGKNKLQMIDFELKSQARYRLLPANRQHQIYKLNSGMFTYCLLIKGNSGLKVTVDEKNLLNFRRAKIKMQVLGKILFPKRMSFGLVELPFEYKPEGSIALNETPIWAYIENGMSLNIY